jgi:hypothetical protein
MIFVRKTRAEVCKKYPSMHALQVMKEVGKMWQNLLEEEKNYYEAQAQEDKLRFTQEMNKFETQLQTIMNQGEKSSQLIIEQEVSGSDSKSSVSPKSESKEKVITNIQNKERKRSLKQVRKRNRSNEAVSCSNLNFNTT